MATLMKAVVKGILLVFFSIFLAICFIWGVAYLLEGADENYRKAVAQQEADPGSVGPKTRYLYGKWASTIPVAKNHSASYGLMRFTQSQNAEGINILYEDGDVYEVERNTRVTIRGSYGEDGMKVRIDSGPHQGAIVFVDHKYLRDAPYR